MILAAGGLESDEARDAWDRLAEAYWYPLYAYARRRGSKQEDAQDLVQGFFERLLEKARLKADPERGRFRSYLLTAFRNFSNNEWQRTKAKKRGGDHPVVSLFDSTVGEQRLRLEPFHEITPDLLYQRAWAKTLLGRVLEELGRRYEKAGKGAFFKEVKEELIEPTENGNKAHAEALEMNPGNFRVAMHRLRKAYRKLLEEEVAHTLQSEQESEINAELQQLFAALSSD